LTGEDRDPRWGLQSRSAHLARKKGTLNGTLDSLDEEVNGMQLDTVALTGHNLRFTVPSIDGTYEARLNASSSAIEGTWKQNGQSLPLVLERVNK
jgi:uncharacterized protein